MHLSSGRTWAKIDADIVKVPFLAHRLDARARAIGRGGSQALMLHADYQSAWSMDAKARAERSSYW
jgi:hypothetical protein